MPYDPFVRGRFPVSVRTIEALDTARGRLFPVEIWYPAAAQHVGEDLAPGAQDVRLEAANISERPAMSMSSDTQPFALICGSSHSSK